MDYVDVCYEVLNKPRNVRFSFIFLNFVLYNGTSNLAHVVMLSY